MEITQFVATLLRTEKKVCIPGLGTISASGETRPMTAASGETGPEAASREARPKDVPAETPAPFFPFLTGLRFSEKHDAGNRRLAEAIAGNRQIKPNLAGYEVDKFVIRVKQELSRNGSFEFPGVGTLNADASGRIGFGSSLNDRSLFGLGPVELKPLEQGSVVEVITRKIGFKNVRKNKFRLIWAILIGLIILGLVSLLLVRLNIIGV